MEKPIPCKQKRTEGSNTPDQTNYILNQRLTRDKEEHYIMIKGIKSTRRSSNCKYIYIYLNIRISKYKENITKFMPKDEIIYNRKKISSSINGVGETGQLPVIESNWTTFSHHSEK